jgi:uncharacterized membrane protein
MKRYIAFRKTKRVKLTRHRRQVIRSNRKKRIKSRKTIKRKKETEMRKNFLPTLIVTIFLWILIAFLICFLDPTLAGAIFLFLFLSFLALFLTFTTLLANTRHGLLVSSAIITFLILRYLGLGNFLNLILIAGLALTVELFFLKKKQ